MDKVGGGGGKTGGIGRGHRESKFSVDRDFAEHYPLQFALTNDLLLGRGGPVGVFCLAAKTLAPCGAGSGRSRVPIAVIVPRAASPPT